MTKKTKAIVTITIGKEHTELFERYCMPTWKPYADKHGYDIIVIREPVKPELVTETKSIHWQKCFVLTHEDVKEYEDVVWIDTDILINYHRAPCIVSNNLSDKIGAVSLQMLSERISENTSGRFLPYKNYCINMFQTPENKAMLQNHFRKKKLDHHYFECNPLMGINTGVLVMKPTLHSDFMQNVFYKYQSVEKTQDFEQGPIAVELINQNMVNYIDPGFNVIFYYHLVHHYPFLWDSVIAKNVKLREMLCSFCATTSYINSYFLHFAGEKVYMPFIATETKDEFEIPNFFVPGQLF